MIVSISILLFIIILVLIWHLNFIKQQQQQHNDLVANFEHKIACQNALFQTNLIENKTSLFQDLQFKLNILKEQVAILELISNSNNNTI